MHGDERGSSAQSSSAPHSSDSIRIHGAGMAEVDGLYKKTAASGPGGRPVYTHESFSHFKIQWSSKSEVWLRRPRARRTQNLYSLPE
jgi:hypothetical protein